MVNIAGNKLKEDETTYKAAQAELTRATEFDAERQVKIDERKLGLNRSNQLGIQSTGIYWL